MSKEHNHKIDLIIEHLLGACKILESLKTVQETPRTPEPVAPVINKFKRLVCKENWPVAEKNLCGSSDSERYKRATAVLDQLVDVDIIGKNFLDLKCGTGDIAHAAAVKGARLAVGHDVQPMGWSRFSGTPRLILDSGENLLRSYSYGVILLYDCLERCENPLDILRVASSLLSPQGSVYVRCRPWTSRHGFGDVRILNKAFAHLCLSESELASLGCTSLPMHRVSDPSEYEEWFRQSGLEVRWSREIRRPVEPLFKTSLLANKISEALISGKFPEEQIAICYVDYALELMK